MRRVVLLVAVVAFGFAAQNSKGEVSLALEDRIDDIPVKVDSQMLKFTVIRDAWNPKQWYVVPDRPRLATRLDSKQRRVPELSMLLIQSEDNAKQTITEEALLQFAVTLAVPAEATDTLKDAIATQYKGEKLDRSQILLSGLPLLSSEATVVVPKTEGDFLVGTAFGDGVGPTFATQEQVFLLRLTRKGADALKAALSQGNGIAIQYSMKYDGLTPKVGFKVKVNWSQLQTHYSRNDRARARASWFGLVRAGADYDRQEVLNDLVNDKCLEVEVVEGSGFKREDANKYLDPILARINKEFEVQLAPPEKIDPAKADAPEASGFFFGGGYSVAIKNVTTKKSGTETISFSTRQYVERKTYAGGFVSLKPFDEDIREAAVIVVPPGPWQSSYFLLPTVGTNLGIQRADITVKLNRGKENLSTRSAKWEVTDGKGQWTEPKEAKAGPRSMIQFPLLNLGVKNKNDLKNTRYNVKLTLLTASNDEVTIDKEMETFDGSLPLPALSRSLIDIVTINPQALTLAGVKDAGKTNLVAVHVSLKAGNNTLSREITPFNDNGTPLPPRPIYFFVPKNEKGETPPVEATVMYQRKGQQPGKYDLYYETKDMKKELPSLSLILTDDK